ncbi:hypothetical protein YC2023_117114 [Brassica napus]
MATSSISVTTAKTSLLQHFFFFSDNLLFFFDKVREMKKIWNCKELRKEKRRRRRQIEERNRKRKVTQPQHKLKLSHKLEKRSREDDFGGLQRKIFRKNDWRRRFRGSRYRRRQDSELVRGRRSKHNVDDDFREEALSKRMGHDPGKRCPHYARNIISADVRNCISLVGQSLVVFDVVFLVVGLPSIVFARLGFQDLVFGVLTSMLSFIARERLHSLLISCAELVSWSFGPFYPELCGVFTCMVVLYVRA